MSKSDRAEAELVRTSGLFDAEWYLNRYPDVARLGMDPAEHYLRLGAMLGRDPGPSFHTTYYADKNLGGRLAGVNPLVHYVRIGKKAGLPRSRPKRRGTPMTQVDALRLKLLSCGFTRKPLAELCALMVADPNPSNRDRAGREVALWHMRGKTVESYKEALSAIALARGSAEDHQMSCTLVTLDLLCRYFLGDAEGAAATYESAALAGEVDANVMLAWANHQPMSDRRLVWINQALGFTGVPKIALTGDRDSSDYDRLTSAKPLPSQSEGPLVTVLIAAYQAADTLSAALRSLQEQTWRNLEILVIDDCSPGPETVAVAERFAEADPRIRVIRMEANGGAYVARNRGLDETTGEFVTIHDADDWSHPLKIETQVRHLIENPSPVACTSQQARATSDLVFSRWDGQGRFVIRNVSSLMWRRKPVRDKLGYWDTVRFSADSELIRRMECVFGRDAVVNLRTGPLSFQRDSETSIIADDVMGVNGFFFGARKEYLDAQRHHHASGASLHYSGDPAERPFPVPALMRPDRAKLVPGRHFDIVFAGDFRSLDEPTRSAIGRLRLLRDSGKRVGIFEALDYHRPITNSNNNKMHADLRAEIDGTAVQVLVYGDNVTCSELEVVTPGVDLGDYRYLPGVTVLGDGEAADRDRSTSGAAEGVPDVPARLPA